MGREKTNRNAWKIIQMDLTIYKKKKKKKKEVKRRGDRNKLVIW